MNSQNIMSLTIGFIIGYLKLKPFYFIQYYIPENINPMVEKGPYYEQINHHNDIKTIEERCDRNKRYYEHLLFKLHE